MAADGQTDGRRRCVKAFNRHIKTAEQRTTIGCSNTVIGTLAVDGWAVILVQRGEDWAGPQPTQALLAVPNVIAHPSIQRPV